MVFGRGVCGFRRGVWIWGAAFMSVKGGCLWLFGLLICLSSLPLWGVPFSGSLGGFLSYESKMGCLCLLKGQVVGGDYWKPKKQKR